MSGGEGLEARLRSLLGLNAYEARAYLALLSGGPLKPREVAYRASIPPQRVYDVLQSLFRKGLVARLADGRYEAYDPARSLGARAREVVEEARRRARLIEELASELARLREPSGHRGDVFMVAGLARAVAAAVEALERCGDEAFFMVYKVAVEASSLRGLVEEMLARVSGKARILIPDSVDLPGWAVEALKASGVEARASPASILDLMVACDTVVIGVPGAGDVVAVVVRNSEFADALRKRLVEAWSRAEPLVG